MTVDAERLLSGWLREQPAVTDIVGSRIYTTFPRGAEFPMLRLTQIGGAPVYSTPLFLDEAVIQLDCYGGPKLVARSLMDAARLTMSTGLRGKHDMGVVTDVRWHFARYLPDDTLDPPQPRWITEVSVFTRPLQQEAP